MDNNYGIQNIPPIEKTEKKINKYWGDIETIYSSEDFCLKKIFMKKDCQSSLEYHVKKGNTHLKRLENFTKIMDGYADVLNPQWKEYNDIKAEMVAGIGAVQDKSQQ